MQIFNFVNEFNQWDLKVDLWFNIQLYFGSGGQSVVSLHGEYITASVIIILVITSASNSTE